MGSLPEWIKRGFVNSDIWKELGDYVAEELLSPENLHFYKSNEEKRNQEREKLSEGDRLPDDLLSVVSRYVDSSKLTEFALKHLGFHYQEIDNIRHEYSDAKRINFEVDILHTFQVKIYLFILKFKISNYNLSLEQQIY